MDYVERVVKAVLEHEVRASWFGGGEPPHWVIKLAMAKYDAHFRGKFTLPAMEACAVCARDDGHHTTEEHANATLKDYDVMASVGPDGWRKWKDAKDAAVARVSGAFQPGQFALDAWKAVQFTCATCGQRNDTREALAAHLMSHVTPDRYMEATNGMEDTPWQQLEEKREERPCGACGEKLRNWAESEGGDVLTRTGRLSCWRCTWSKEAA